MGFQLCTNLEWLLLLLRLLYLLVSRMSTLILGGPHQWYGVEFVT